MKDKAIMGVQRIETSDPKFSGWFGLRKLFWEYLTKLHVPFYDSCCPDASSNGRRPVKYNEVTGRLEYFNGTDWVAVTSFSTTTTTTAAPTTTTTTTTVGP